jgi:hypothetical protein
MKLRKKIILAITAAGLMTAGIVYGDDPVKGDGSDSTTGSTGLGWQEGTQRTLTIHTDGLNINSGVSVGKKGFSVDFGLSTNVVRIYCCKAYNDIHSWCNFDADDERCGN